MKEYEIKAAAWLNGDFDQQTKDEVAHLRDTDPKGLEDAFYKNLEFGTGGLRGIMGAGTNRMNKYTVGMATQGLANYMLGRFPGAKDLSICVSFDSRNHSREFAHITADVMSANGIHVYLFDDIRPTPELSYSIRHKGATAGVMVTASHNPKEYNGYKVFWSDGGQITSPEDKDIVAEVNKVSEPSMVKFVPGAGAAPIDIMGADVDECYLRDILSLTLSPEACARHADMKIVYTPLHGCGVRLVPECLKRLGFKHIYHVPEQDVSDGNFPTVVSPNPEEQSALEMAVAKAEEVGADLVMATDPDADRMGIAVRDPQGRMVLFNGNQTASLMTYYVMNRWKELGKLGKGKYAVKTIVTTSLIKEIAESFGAPCYDVLTGFKYIAEVVRRKEAEGGEFICGGEESYGFNLGQFVRDKDAQISASIIAETAAWAADQGLTLYGLMQKVYAEYGLHRDAMVYIVRKGVEGTREIAAMMTAYRNNPPADLGGAPVARVVDYLEPEKTGLPKSNVLQFFSADGDVVSVRPSGTEPKIKFYFSTKGPDANAKIEALKKQFLK
ncbi:MAG: phospho-sugar mutase [Bacteroidales bacterium]|nr:phospho-sugar mutase [Bacteroidales bacterium]